MPDAENSLDVLSQLLFPLPLSTCRLEYPFNKRPYHGIEPRILLSLSLSKIFYPENAYSPVRAWLPDKKRNQSGKIRSIYYVPTLAESERQRGIIEKEKKAGEKQNWRKSKREREREREAKAFFDRRKTRLDFISFIV